MRYSPPDSKRSTPKKKRRPEGRRFLTGSNADASADASPDYCSVESLSFNTRGVMNTSSSVFW
jgi:hypothetical protein